MKTIRILRSRVASRSIVRVPAKSVVPSACSWCIIRALLLRESSTIRCLVDCREDCCTTILVRCTVVLDQNLGNNIQQPIVKGSFGKRFKDSQQEFHQQYHLCRGSDEDWLGVESEIDRRDAAIFHGLVSRISLPYCRAELNCKDH